MKSSGSSPFTAMFEPLEGGDGRVSIEAFKAALQKLGQGMGRKHQLSGRTAAYIANVLDSEGSGYISYQTMLAMMHEKAPQLMQSKVLKATLPEKLSRRGIGAQLGALRAHGNGRRRMSPRSAQSGDGASSWRGDNDEHDGEGGEDGAWSSDGSATEKRRRAGDGNSALSARTPQGRSGRRPMVPYLDPTSAAIAVGGLLRNVRSPRHHGKPRPGTASRRRRASPPPGGVRPRRSPPPGREWAADSMRPGPSTGGRSHGGRGVGGTAKERDSGGRELPRRQVAEFEALVRDDAAVARWRKRIAALKRQQSAAIVAYEEVPDAVVFVHAHARACWRHADADAVRCARPLR